jgi:predicted phage terminase large subunit-like protein
LYNARRILVEDMGSGMALVQELLGKVPGIVAVKSDRDKESRITAISSKFESGLVFLPKSALWLADFEAELFAFPGAKYDDQCDSVSQALWEPNVRFPMRISNEALAAASWPGATHREPLRCIGGF